jgi:hypothetical protein
LQALPCECSQPINKTHRVPIHTLLE